LWLAMTSFPGVSLRIAWRGTASSWSLSSIMRLRSPDGLQLCIEDLRRADTGEAEQPKQSFLVITSALRSRLSLCDLAVRKQDEIRIGLGIRVLIIIEVEYRSSLIDAAADPGDLLLDRIDRQRTLRHQLVHGEAQRHPRAGNRGGAGAAIGLDDVAIERDLAFAEQLEIGDGAKAAADQALDFLSAARLLALGRLTRAARVR